MLPIIITLLKVERSNYQDSRNSVFSVKFRVEIYPPSSRHHHHNPPHYFQAISTIFIIQSRSLKYSITVYVHNHKISTNQNYQHYHQSKTHHCTKLNSKWKTTLLCYDPVSRIKRQSGGQNDQNDFFCI